MVPLRCSKCSTFGHDCILVPQTRPTHEQSRARSSQDNHKAQNVNCIQKAKVNDQQVVNRRDKGKKISDTHPQPRELGPLNGAKNDGNIFADFNPFNGIDEQAMKKDLVEGLQLNLQFGISPSCQLSTVPTCAHTGLIPCIYYSCATDIQEECQGNLLDEETHERYASIEDSHEDVLEVAFTMPQSARQRKKEAKIHFSGNYPKGCQRVLS